MSTTLLASGITHVIDATNGSNGVRTTNGYSNIADNIAKLRQFYEEGILDKNQLKLAIDKCTAAPSEMNRVQSERPPPTTAVQKALKVVWRRPSSPDTTLIRRVIEGPMHRRFRLQCALEDSKLWGQVKPRRLNGPLFNMAIEQPLEDVFQRHQQARSPSSSPSRSP